jgi:hypothetical protein
MSVSKQFLVSNKSLLSEEFLASRQRMLATSGQDDDANKDDDRDDDGDNKGENRRRLGRQEMLGGACCPRKRLEGGWLIKRRERDWRADG